MKIATLVMLTALPLAGVVTAQTAPPAAPKPCVTMPRQGPAQPPATGRPRERCPVAAFLRMERIGR